MDAEDEVIRQHAGLVHKLARRVHRQLQLDCELDDLVAFGYEGLLHAKRRYDPARGVRFSSFAYYRVHGAILDGVRRMAHLPRRTYVKLRAAQALNGQAEAVGEQRGQYPNDRHDVTRTLRAIDDILGRLATSYAVSAAADEPDARPSPEAQVVSADRRSRALEAVDSLPERERALVRGFYFEDRTLDEVASELGMSKSWASRLHAKALGRLRKCLIAQER